MDIGEGGPGMRGGLGERVTDTRLYDYRAALLLVWSTALHAIRRAGPLGCQGGGVPTAWACREQPSSGAVALTHHFETGLVGMVLRPRDHVWGRAVVERVVALGIPEVRAAKHAAG